MQFWRNLFRSNYRAGKRATQTMAAQVTGGDGALVCPENPILPAHLIELKDTYENAMVSRFEGDYLRKTRKLAAKLDVACVAGIENIQLMRSGIFHWLSVQQLMKRWGIVVWVLFFLGMATLAVLDFAPATLVFNTLMEDEGIVPMICREMAAPAAGGPLQCVRYLLDRETITLVAILAFLFGVVMIGHVLAKIFLGEFFDRNISGIGIGLLIVTVGVFVMLSGIRFVHEEKVSLQKYEEEKSRLEIAIMNAPPSAVSLEQQMNYMQSADGKAAFLSGYFWKNIFASSLFSIISLIIMLIAVYLSLWREYGDIRYMIRQRKFITSRIAAEEIRTELESFSNSLIAKLSQLRQSAQREVAEFFGGVEAGIDPAAPVALRMAILECSRTMRTAFNDSLSIPAAITDHASTRLPESELDWGSQYCTYIENAVFYDAFEKGAQDAVNMGVRNPKSISASLTTTIALTEAWKKAHPNINDTRLDVEYEAGYVEGSRVKFGVGWKSENSGK